MIGRPKLVLASGSPRRVTLINQAGIEPDALRPTDIDETPKRGELPRACANRLARAKAEAALALINIDEELRGAYILSADTVVAVGRRILPKADLLDEAAQCLRLLSGRNHRVHTAVCLVTPSGAFRQRLVETKVRFKRLNDEDIEAYLASGEWRGKAGAYAAQGHRRLVHRQARRVLFQRGRPAALRDHRALAWRGLSDPLRLAQRRVDTHINAMTDQADTGSLLRNARSAPSRAQKHSGRSVPSAAATSTSIAGCPASMPCPARRKRTRTASAATVQAKKTGAASARSANEIRLNPRSGAVLDSAAISLYNAPLPSFGGFSAPR